MLHFKFCFRFISHHTGY